MQLSLAIGGLAQRSPVENALHEALSCPTCFIKSGRPRSGKCHQLRTMHETDALMSKHLRLPRTPLC